MRAWIRRHPLIAFFALAYALSWWPWLWTRLDPANAPSTILPTGPLLAALIVLPVVGGWPAVKAFLSKIVAWRVDLRWYLVVLLLPPAITFSSLGLNLLLGATATGVSVPGGLDFAGNFIFILLFIGLGEEPAWRGFALPRLLAKHGALAASLILGLWHALWHITLFGVEYDLGNLLPWLIGVLSFAVLVTWVWRHTGGSLLLPMLFHTSVNSTAFPFRWFAGAELIALWWLFAALWCLAAIVVVWRCGPTLTRGKT